MKQFLLLFIVSTVFSILASAQSAGDAPERYLVTIQGDTIRKAPGEFFPIFVKVEIVPFFPGGAKAWYNFLKKNLVYPDSLKSPNWEPATQGGRKVTAYTKEFIAFRLSDEE